MEKGIAIETMMMCDHMLIRDVDNRQEGLLLNIKTGTWRRAAEQVEGYWHVDNSVLNNIQQLCRNSLGDMVTAGEVGGIINANVSVQREKEKGKEDKIKIGPDSFKTDSSERTDHHISKYREFEDTLHPGLTLYEYAQKILDSGMSLETVLANTPVGDLIIPCYESDIWWEYSRSVVVRDIMAAGSDEQDAMQYADETIATIIHKYRVFRHTTRRQRRSEQSLHTRKKRREQIQSYSNEKSTPSSSNESYKNSSSKDIDGTTSRLQEHVINAVEINRQSVCSRDSGRIQCDELERETCTTKEKEREIHKTSAGLKKLNKVRRNIKRRERKRENKSSAACTTSPAAGRHCEDSNITDDGRDCLGLRCFSSGKGKENKNRKNGCGDMSFFKKRRRGKNDIMGLYSKLFSPSITFLLLPIFPWVVW
jgi:hypothetical protein